MNGLVEKVLPYECIIDPREYQETELALYGEEEFRHLFWTMRSGKSKAAIDCASNLWFKGKIERIVIFTRKGLHTDWISQHFPVHCPVPWKGFVWYSNKRKRVKFIAEFKSLLPYEGLQVFAFNNHSILIPQTRKFLKHILKQPTFLIVDESSDFGRVSSRMTRLLIVFAQKCRYRRILSGSYLGNSPLRTYAQFQILKKGCLGFTRFDDFKHEFAITTMDQNYQGQWYERIEGYKNLDKLKGLISQYGRIIRKKDIPNLPKLMYTTITIEPTTEQIRVYKSIAREIETELRTGMEVKKYDVMVKMQKLQQVLSNFLKTDTGISIIDEKQNPRLDMLFHQLLIEQEKSIVWCRYRYEVQMVFEEAKRREIPCVQVHGGVGIGERDNRIMGFRNYKGLMLFVATAKSVGLGKNLSGAKTIYWFSKSFDAVEEQQGEERATVIGSESIGVVSLQTPSSIDTYIQKSLDQKHDYYKTMDVPNWRMKLLDDLQHIKLVE